MDDGILALKFARYTKENDGIMRHLLDIQLIRWNNK